MINKLGLIIFILASQHYTLYNIYNLEPNWKQSAYMILALIGGIMYIWEKNE